MNRASGLDFRDLPCDLTGQIAAVLGWYWADQEENPGRLNNLASCIRAIPRILAGTEENELLIHMTCEALTTFPNHTTELKEVHQQILKFWRETVQKRNGGSDPNEEPEDVYLGTGNLG
jgi:hypothetical protein